MLHTMCGKIAAGKFTLAARLSAQPATVLIVEDEWLNALYADELSLPKDYVRCTGKLRAALTSHIAHLLEVGVSVVLDFSSNTVQQLRWMRDLLDETHAAHQTHVLRMSDAECLARLKARNATGEHPFTVTEEQFHAFSRQFTEPSPEEGFNLVLHGAAD